MDITIRPVEPAEHAVLGEITAEAYLGDGLLDFGADDPYLVQLRDVARRAAEAEVLVAADARGRVLGGV
ncbi:GNAT family N-acetyltransferase, partial [Streptomyces laculatispora]|nr:GNAT family N-acetyltransferase [Streptomyces laculatispora]